MKLFLIELNYWTEDWMWFFLSEMYLGPSQVSMFFLQKEFTVELWKLFSPKNSIIDILQDLKYITVYFTIFWNKNTENGKGEIFD